MDNLKKINKAISAIDKHQKPNFIRYKDFVSAGHDEDNLIIRRHQIMLNPDQTFTVSTLTASVAFVGYEVKESPALATTSCLNHAKQELDSLAVLSEQEGLDLFDEMDKPIFKTGALLEAKLSYSTENAREFYLNNNANESLFTQMIPAGIRCYLLVDQFGKLSIHHPYDWEFSQPLNTPIPFNIRMFASDFMKNKKNNGGLFEIIHSDTETQITDVIYCNQSSQIDAKLNDRWQLLASLLPKSITDYNACIVPVNTNSRTWLHAYDNGLKKVAFVKHKNSTLKESTVILTSNPKSNVQLFSDNNGHCTVKTETSTYPLGQLAFKLRNIASEVVFAGKRDSYFLCML